MGGETVGTEGETELFDVAASDGLDVSTFGDREFGKLNNSCSFSGIFNCTVKLEFHDGVDEVQKGAPTANLALPLTGDALYIFSPQLAKHATDIQLRLGRGFRYWFSERFKGVSFLELH